MKSNPESGFETITPKLATLWLETLNTNNRPVSDLHVSRMAAAMTRGEWRTTHQGIAFGADGSLYDGQHRLWAIIQANTPITMMVTRGLAEEARANIDGQRNRSVADNFTILSGEANARRLVEVANIIYALISGERAFKSTFDQARLTVQKYRTDLEWALSLPGGRTKLGSAAIRGALAFARKTDPEKLAEFAEQVMVGANLAENAPALLLRNLVLNQYNRKSLHNRRGLAVRALRAAYAHLNGEILRSLFATEDAIAFFAKAHNISIKTSAPGGNPLVWHTTEKKKKSAASVKVGA